MTDQQSSPGAESPVADLQPITFQPIQGGSYTVTYQALVEDKNAPGAPVYSLTVTTATPSSDGEEEELQALLTEMRASFALLPEPNPEDTPEDPGPFDPSMQIQITPELLELSGPGPVGVVATVQTTTGVALQVGSVPALDRPDVVPAGKDHYWRASGGAPLKATVTPSGGYGTIRSLRSAAIDVSVGHPGCLRATEVIVHGTSRMDYSISNYFNGPYTKP